SPPSPLAPKGQPASSPPKPLLPPEAFEAPPAPEALPSLERPRAFNVPSLQELDMGRWPEAKPEPDATPEVQTSLQLPPRRTPSPRPERRFAPGPSPNRAPDPEAPRFQPTETTAASRNLKAKLPDSDDAIRAITDSRASAPPLLATPPVAPPQPPPAIPLPVPPLVGAPPGAPLVSEAPPAATPQRAASPP